MTEVSLLISREVGSRSRDRCELSPGPVLDLGLTGDSPHPGTALSGPDMSQTPGQHSFLINNLV